MSSFGKGVECVQKVSEYIEITRTESVRSLFIKRLLLQSIIQKKVTP